MHVHAQALELHDVEKDMAAFIKKHFDGKFEPTWHCVVGTSFGAAQHKCVSVGVVCGAETIQSSGCSAGSYVTHETGYFIYLNIGEALYVALMRVSDIKIALRSSDFRSIPYCLLL